MRLEILEDWRLNRDVEQEALRYASYPVMMATLDIHLLQTWPLERRVKRNPSFVYSLRVYGVWFDP